MVAAAAATVLAARPGVVAGFVAVRNPAHAGAVVAEAGGDAQEENSPSSNSTNSNVNASANASTNNSTNITNNEGQRFAAPAEINVPERPTRLLVTPRNRNTPLGTSSAVQDSYSYKCCRCNRRENGCSRNNKIDEK